LIVGEFKFDTEAGVACSIMGPEQMTAIVNAQGIYRVTVEDIIKAGFSLAQGAVAIGSKRAA